MYSASTPSKLLPAHPCISLEVPITFSYHPRLSPLSWSPWSRPTSTMQSSTRRSWWTYHSTPLPTCTGTGTRTSVGIRIRVASSPTAISPASSTIAPTSTTLPRPSRSNIRLPHSPSPSSARTRRRCRTPTPTPPRTPLQPGPQLLPRTTLPGPCRRITTHPFKRSRPLTSLIRSLPLTRQRSRTQTRLRTRIVV